MTTEKTIRCFQNCWLYGVFTYSVNTPLYKIFSDGKTTKHAEEFEVRILFIKNPNLYFYSFTSQWLPSPAWSYSSARRSAPSTATRCTALWMAADLLTLYAYHLAHAEAVSRHPDHPLASLLLLSSAALVCSEFALFLHLSKQFHRFQVCGNILVLKMAVNVCKLVGEYRSLCSA